VHLLFPANICQILDRDTICIYTYIYIYMNLVHDKSSSDSNSDVSIDEVDNDQHDLYPSDFE